jgi:trk system potassium uptake protein
VSINQKSGFTLSAKSTVGGSGRFWIKLIQILAITCGLSASILDWGFTRPGRGDELPGFLAKVPEVYFDNIEYVAIIGCVLALWLHILLHPTRKDFLKEHIVELVLSIAATVTLIVVLTGNTLLQLTKDQIELLTLCLSMYLVVQILAGSLKFNTWLIGTKLNPAWAIPFGFALVILTGALLLCLPAASYSERFPDFGNNFVDHLFTSTSAVCVTGLNVRDTATYYTPFGRVIIVLLIQAGGLGIIIFGTLFAILLGRQITLHEANLMKDIYSQEEFGQIGKVVKFVIFSTFLIEGIGAAFLYPMWDTPYIPERIFKSCFHSVSAFCNAGFALQPDNLISYAGNWQTYGIIATLIILGGLGFPVMSNIYQVVKYRLFKKKKRVINLEHFRFKTLTLQTKIVLVTTLCLIVFGMLAMFLIETPHTQHRWGRSVQYEDVAVNADPAVMRNHAPFQRLLDAYFLSVTARTAGFNSVDMTTGKLHPGTLLVLIFLMFIGGSPASTAGGIKTVTFVILFAAVVAAVRQRRNIEMFKRTIDPGIVRRALVILLIYSCVVAGISFALVLTHPQIGYLDLLFETTSACGTVGLSTGVTPNLSLAGRLLIVFGMFAGRLGPLTLLFAMAGTPKRIRYEYPREGLITG